MWKQILLALSVSNVAAIDLERQQRYVAGWPSCDGLRNANPGGDEECWMLYSYNMCDSDYGRAWMATNCAASCGHCNEDCGETD